MSEWREVTLGDTLEVKHGFAFKGQYFTDEGDLIVLTPGNFFESGGFKRKSGTEKYYVGPVPDGYLLQRGDVVVAMTEQAEGLLGSSATIPQDDRYLHNQRIGLLRITDPARLDQRFCYHLMNSPTVRRQIQATATGSKVRHTAPERIRAVRVPLPGVETQRAIAGILDDMDEMVESNRRRTQILEEMAKAIYREWFVHFRFRGADDSSLIESTFGLVPEGWKVRDIGDVLELRYGKALKADDRQGGPVAVVGSSGVVGWHNAPLVSGPVVVLGRKGNVGSVTWITGSAWPIDTTYFVVSELPLPFVYEQLSRNEFVNTHAAVPGLSREDAYRRPFLVPPDELMDRYAQAWESFNAERDALDHEATLATGIRDLLLPKLVSGQIDVPRLDLDAVAEATT